MVAAQNAGLIVMDDRLIKDYVVDGLKKLDRIATALERIVKALEPQQTPPVNWTETLIFDGRSGKPIKVWSEAEKSAISIPLNVYWNVHADNFYTIPGDQGCGTEFYQVWYQRRDEFIQSTRS